MLELLFFSGNLIWHLFDTRRCSISLFEPQFWVYHNDSGLLESALSAFNLVGHDKDNERGLALRSSDILVTPTHCTF